MHFQLQCNGDEIYSGRVDILEPRSRGFPAGLLDRAFYARVKRRQNPKARFNGLTPAGFSRDAKAVDSKHAGSALIVSLLSEPQR